MVKLSFRICSFIPDSVSKYTFTVGLGYHRGALAVLLPANAIAGIGNTFKPRSAAYLTGQRTLSKFPIASARMRSSHWPYSATRIHI
jgi:hypothetical protein